MKRRDKDVRPSMKAKPSQRRMKTKACRDTTGYSYMENGLKVHVLCELPRDHDGPHAAWTWDNSPYPRVEWDNEPVTTLSVQRTPSTEEKP